MRPKTYSESFYIIIILSILFYGGLAIGSFNEHSTQYYLGKAESKLNANLKEDIVNLVKDKYSSLIQAPTNTATDDDLNQALSDVFLTFFRSVVILNYQRHKHLRIPPIL